MMRLFVVFAVVFFSVAHLARAQSSDEVVWVQIEAQPSLQGGENRARAYSSTLADVNGFSLGNGWYGIVLGPYTAADAQQVLQVYRADGLIPRDSYIVASAALAQQFFPADVDILQRSRQSIEPVETAQGAPLLPEATVDQGPTLTLQGLSQSPSRNLERPVETPAEARRNERDLSPAERRQIQTALQWAGFYNSTIDGAFGRGTRSSMSAWQQVNGFEPTGVLTTLQRAALLNDYNAVLEGLDLRRVTDTLAGIEMIIPSGKLEFRRYEAPFAQFEASDGSNARLLLISQEGDANTLASLFEIMQTLEIVPLQGPRDLSKTGFSLIGRNADIISETRVTLSDDQIKGFTLIWPSGDEERRTRLLKEMQASFTKLPGVLDPSVGTDTQQQVDLVAGLQIRKPRISRSGFFVDQNGTVITTSEAVQSCTRITLDEEFEADLKALDGELGVALLTPSARLSPPQVARFSAALPRLQSDVAVAGYSYEGVLDAPTMTFGKLSDLRGLRGEQDLSRLALASLPGDAGGPVFDEKGDVLGMLLPRGGGERQLPKDVTFALAGSAIASVMENAGLVADSGNGLVGTAPEDITQQARAMTVLVSCWE
ncbi:MAG: serine protease [Paracoccaceae bacterium]|nr:serine protease [Paracoccaceae bacterium]